MSFVMKFVCGCMQYLIIEIDKKHGIPLLHVSTAHLTTHFTQKKIEMHSIWLHYINIVCLHTYLTDWSLRIALILVVTYNQLIMVEFGRRIGP